MICHKCGRVCPPAAKFCSMCGTTLKEPENFQQPYNLYQPIVDQNCVTKKKKSKKVFVFSFIGVIIIGLLIIFLFIIPKRHRSNYILNSNRLMTLYQEFDGYDTVNYFINPRGGIVTHTESIADYNMIQLSQNREIYAVCNKGSLSLLSDRRGQVNVSSDVIGYALSLDGTGIAYVTSRNHMDTKGDLYLYDVTENRKKEITTDCYFKDIIISPDGDSVAFVNDYEDEYNFTSSYSINEKKEKILESQTLPYAISNDGDIIYYIKDMEFYVKSKGKSEKLCSSLSQHTIFNYDLTEVVFVDNDKTYLWTQKDGKQEISDHRLYDVVQPKDSTYSNINIQLINQQETWNELPNQSVLWNESAYQVYGLRHFTNQIYLFDNGYVYYDANMKEHELSVSTDQEIYISDTGKTAMYYNKYRLFFIDLEDKELKETQVADDLDICYLWTNSDLTDIYYSNTDNELIYINAKGKTKKIAEDVYDFIPYQASVDGKLYFLTDDQDHYGTLYYSENGSDKVKVRGADEVELYTLYYLIMYNIENGDGTINKYVVIDGKPVLIWENFEKYY